MNLKAELENLPSGVEPSPWLEHEHVRGYGVFGLPLSSGHTLALRVFPVNDFAPYITVWHQAPNGEWTIFYNAPRPDIACPRYYGAAAKYVIPAKINLEWRAVSELKIRIEQPKLEWTVWMREPAVLRFLNKVNGNLPFWTWKLLPLLKMREKLAGTLGIGNIKLSDQMPSGHHGVLMPKRMYFIDRANASLEGVDLGVPARVRSNPKIGEVALPARGIFSIGQAHWDILDKEEYHRTRKELGIVNSF